MAEQEARIAELESTVQALTKRLERLEAGGAPAFSAFTKPEPAQDAASTILSGSVPSAGSGLVYIGMAADIVHHGHVNIISVAKQLGRVVVGLLTDEAIESYKRKTVVNWEARKKLVEALKGVDMVVPQATLDYIPNLEWLRPAFVVHGDDWAKPDSKQYKTRCLVRDKLAEWGGQLIEPPYTSGISTTEIISEAGERANTRKRQAVTLDTIAVAANHAN